MTATSYADRARRFRESRQHHTHTSDEIDERNEIIPSPGPAPTFAPLDDVIAADVAARRPHLEVVARVERLRLAANEAATPLDRVVLADWEKILHHMESTS